MGISTETASKLLQGEFRKLDEVRQIEIDNINNPNADIFILYRSQIDDVKDIVYIVETFFVNENH